MSGISHWSVMPCALGRLSSFLFYVFLPRVVCVSLFASLSLCFTWLLGQVSGFSLLSRYMHCSATSHCFAAPAVFCMLPCWVQFSPFVLS